MSVMLKQLCYMGGRSIAAKFYLKSPDESYLDLKNSSLAHDNSSHFRPNYKCNKGKAMSLAYKSKTVSDNHNTVNHHSKELSAYNIIQLPSKATRAIKWAERGISSICITNT